MITEFIDNLFRFGAIINLVWIVLLGTRNNRTLTHPHILVAMAVSTMCFLVVAAYDEVALFGAFGLAIEFMARLVIVLTWLFSITLFSDNFKFGRFYQLVLGIYVVRSLVFQLDVLSDELFATISFVMRGTIYLHLIYLVLSELPGDFLEKRRQFRVWFVCILIFVPTAATIERVFISETLYLDSNSILESVSIFLLSCLLLIHIARPREKYIFEKKGVVGSESNTTEISDKHLAELIPADRHSLEILEAKMLDGLYREPGLTISRIAKVVNVPEHRLRNIINHHLGYRNISQYLNSYRIEESKNRLADVDERHIPILTIAMEVGYMSLRPFNRAFKNLTNQTPTEYREQQLSSCVASVSRHDPSKAE